MTEEPLTRIELALLDSVGHGPKSRCALRREVELFVDDIRPSTVTGLILSLVNAGLMAITEDARLAETPAGRAARQRADCGNANSCA